ncbi:S26 family signal peptidase [Halarchaeum nitratireducens]|uniref:S26 family signal peptidase n=1 Tax=Halarchaeum nitratireducens TaxID=489913 RepID=A0A830GFS9_9EURY|nr:MULTISPECIES: S26 family signal peptidase [Halarchaeum]MBP2252859.1 signal peptidase [Halarchaeum solikamskense]GGN26573.1 S26 family signal peptidase [Halarchaeum nitratireducens]
MADDVPNPRDGPLAALRWFRRTDNEAVLFVRELVSSALVVVLIGVLLFAVSGLWPPLVAVESGSMTPHLQKGDLVFVMEEHRFAGAGATGATGVVTYQTGERTGYAKFGEPGDVVVYAPDGDRGTTPIIHRARFWVADGENWYDEANASYVLGAKDCEELRNCPAPHAGFITKGDSNPAYDQAVGISTPVRPDWVRGTAEFHIPWLGWVRLVVTGDAPLTTPLVTGDAVTPSGTAIPTGGASAAPA